MKGQQKCYFLKKNIKILSKRCKFSMNFLYIRTFFLYFSGRFAVKREKNRNNIKNFCAGLRAPKKSKMLSSKNVIFTRKISKFQCFNEFVYIEKFSYIFPAAKWPKKIFWKFLYPKSGPYLRHFDLKIHFFL